MQTKMIHFLYVVFFFRKSLELRAKYIYTYELYYTNFDVYLIDCWTVSNENTDENKLFPFDFCITVADFDVFCVCIVSYSRANTADFLVIFN